MSGAGAAPTVTVTALRAVVPRVALAADALHAGPVVVGPRARRGAETDRLGTGPRGRQAEHPVGADLGVAGGDRRVRGEVVAQRRRGRAAAALVAHRRPQGEGGPRGRAAAAHRRGFDDQVRGRTRAHGDRHRARAVVPRVALAADALHARPVVVGPRARRGPETDRLGAGPRGRQAEHPVGADLGVAGGDRRVRGEVVAQRRRGRAAAPLVAHRRPQRERGPGRRAAAAHRRSFDDQVRGRTRADRDRHRTRAVVARVALAADAFHARPVVPGPRARRGAETDPLGAGPGGGQGEHVVGADLGVAGGDRRVRGEVVTQRRRGRAAAALVAHRRPQRERGPGHRAAAHRRGFDDQVRSRSGAHGYRHRARAVVPRTALPADALDTGAVVVGPRARRGPEPDRLGAGPAGGQAAHIVGSDGAVAGGNRRVRREVVTQRRRGRAAAPLVAHRRPQREGGPGRRAAAHRRSFDDQVRRRSRADRDRHRPRAVVPRVALAADALHAGPVVIRPSARRSAETGPLGAGPAGRQDEHPVGADHAVAGGNRRVRGDVVAQRRRGRAPAPLVANRRPQGEGGPRGRAAGAHRRSFDDQVRRRSGTPAAATSSSTCAGTSGSPNGDARRIDQSVRPGEQVLHAGAVEVGPLHLVRTLVGPVHLAAGNVEGQPIGTLQAAGDEVFDIGAAQTGPLNLVGAPVGPVHLAAGYVQRQAEGTAQPAGDQILDIGPAQGGPLDLPRARVRPVHPAAGQVEGQRAGEGQAAGNEVLDPGAIEVGPLDPVRLPIRPVHLAAGHVQGQPVGNPQAGDQIYHPGAVEVGPLDLVGARIRPVDPAAGQIQRQSVRTVESGAGDHVFDIGAVQVGPLDLVRPPVRPVQLRRCGSRWRGRRRLLRKGLPDPGGQRRIGGIHRVGGDVVGVGEIGPAVPVDVAEGYVPVVRHDEGGIGAVHGNQQGVENVDPAVVVDIPEDRRRRCLGPGSAARFLDDDVRRSHAGLRPEGRIQVGDQPLTRDSQSIDLCRLGELLARDR